jgi:hypothetical protein
VGSNRILECKITFKSVHRACSDSVHTRTSIGRVNTRAVVVLTVLDVRVNTASVVALLVVAVAIDVVLLIVVVSLPAMFGRDLR